MNHDCPAICPLCHQQTFLHVRRAKLVTDPHGRIVVEVGRGSYYSGGACTCAVPSYLPKGSRVDRDDIGLKLKVGRVI